MTTRIIIDQAASNTARILAQAINSTLTAAAEVRRVRAVLDSTTSGTDFASLATDLGLTSPTSAADAQAVWTIASNAADAPADARIVELSRLDQG